LEITGPTSRLAPLYSSFVRQSIGIAEFLRAYSSSASTVLFFDEAVEVMMKRLTEGVVPRNVQAKHHRR
jgi:hypothetical protein